MTAHLIRGDARNLPLKDGSVQLVVCSPPYFGLRSYGGQASVWGGDPDCPHVLTDGPSAKPLTGGTGTASAKQVTNAGSQFGNAWETTERFSESSIRSEGRAGLGSDHARGRHIRSATCTRCGAWRGELGSEPTPALFVAHLVEVMRECWRVLRDDGVAFVNMGDSMAGSGKGPTGKNGIGDQIKRQGFRPGNPEKNHGNSNRDGLGHVPGTRPKSLLLVPERLAIALADDGWIVRQVLIWAKNNPMPESVKDRWTTAHEYILMLVKQPRYFFDQAGIAESVGQPTRRAATFRHGGVYTHHRAYDNSNQDRTGLDQRDAPESLTGRNGRSVWNISTAPYPGAHYATFNPELPRRCILAASREGDVVLDPFSGSGTTAYVAASLGRVGIGVELSAEYVAQARYGRLAQDFLPLVTA